MAETALIRVYKCKLDKALQKQYLCGMIPEIKINDYTYHLPDERIAKFPLEHRDSSKLLCFRNGEIADHIFNEIPELIPGNAMMVFNETKVVPARLHFQRATGAHIEIFCLEPALPSDYVQSFAAKGHCRWKCIVGNVKRWKEDETIFLMNPESSKDLDKLQLTARLIERNNETSIVELQWNTAHEFSEVLDICGTIPIPPYLNRDTQDIDLERYQTTYALQRGSVAAPTAGLHFTKDVMDRIAGKGVRIEKVCLHVGAGTFLPVKSEEIAGHTMHREPFVVTVDFLKRLSAHKSSGAPLVAVGTTSVRTLESLYWAGVQCLEGKDLRDIDQWEPYGDTLTEYTASQAIDALVDYAKQHGMKEISLGTRIIIVPGYKLRIVDILVTNFHQPQSTLLLLISAFVGDNWHKIYDHALSCGYRFLSYGDSSLLYKTTSPAKVQ